MCTVVSKLDIFFQRIRSSICQICKVELVPLTSQDNTRQSLSDWLTAGCQPIRVVVMYCLMATVIVWKK